MSSASNKLSAKAAESWSEYFKGQDWKFYAGVATTVALAGLGVGALYYSTSSPSNKKKSKRYKSNNKEKDDEIAPLLEEIKPKIDQQTEYLQFVLNQSLEQISKMSEQSKEEAAKKLKEDGNNSFRAKQYDNAIISYSKALDYTINPVFYCNRAACYANLQQYEKVIPDCNAALKMDNKYIKALLRRGQAEEHLEFFREALDDYTSAHILSGTKNDVAAAAVERVLKSISSREAEQAFKDLRPVIPSKALVETFVGPFELGELPEPQGEESLGDESLRSAFKYMDEKHYDLAFDACDKALNNDTSFKLQALVLRAIFYYLMRQIDQAQADVDAAASLDSKAVMPKILHSCLHLDRGHLELAFKTLEDIQELSPDSKEVHYQIGQLHYMSGNNEAAIKSYKRCLEISPSFILAHVQLGVALFKMEKIAQSNRIYTNLVRDYPTSPEAHNYYGELLMAQERISETLEELDLALSCNPQYTLAHVNKAIIHLQYTKDYAEAGACAQRAVETDPKSDIANATLAQIYLLQSKTREAVEAFQRCIEIAKTEQELEAAISYKEAALAQLRFVETYPEFNHMTSN